jgi:hypothetical protein
MVATGKLAEPPFLGISRQDCPARFAITAPGDNGCSPNLTSRTINSDHLGTQLLQISRCRNKAPAIAIFIFLGDLVYVPVWLAFSTSLWSHLATSV